MIDIIPIRDLVLLKKITAEEIQEGIIIPKDEKVNEKPIVCEVKALGPKVTLPLEKGMQVYIEKYSGTPFRHGEENYLLIMEKHILGVLN